MTEEVQNQDVQPSEVPADPITSALSDEEVKPEVAPEVTPEETPKEPEEVKEEAEIPAEGEPAEKEGEGDEGKEGDLDPEEARKEAARAAFEERQRVREERRKRVEEQTKPYVSEAEDETEQRLRAIEVQEYQRIIEHNENVLIGDFERAKSNPDLQIFNPENRESFNQEAWDYALSTYNDAYIQRDENGNMIGVKKSLFDHLTQTAGLLQGAIKKGQIQQVRDSRQMRNNADTKPAASPVEKGKSDPIMDVLSSD